MQRFRFYVPVGILLPLFVLALATLGAAGVPTASGDTPTPTPSASPAPTPSASPTPDTQSTITFRFVHDGNPVTIDLARFSIIADGTPCPQLQPDSYLEVSEFSIQWPLPDDDLPAACRKGPPTLLRFGFSGHYWGGLSREFIWSGGDETFSLDFPVATPTRPPTPPGLTPTATPAFLPFVGASGSSQRGPSITAVGALLVLAGVVTVSCTVRMGGRHNA